MSTGEQLRRAWRWSEDPAAPPAAAALEAFAPNVGIHIGESHKIGKAITIQKVRRHGPMVSLSLCCGPQAAVLHHHAVALLPESRNAVPKPPALCEAHTGRYQDGHFGQSRWAPTSEG